MKREIPDVIRATTPNQLRKAPVQKKPTVPKTIARKYTVTTNAEKEALNEVYKQITVQTIEEINRLKKPSKAAFEACRFLCLFINTFRDVHKKWPKESFSSWVTV